MSKISSSVAALLFAAAGSAIFYISFVKWIPVFYAASVVLFGLAAGAIAAHFSQGKKILRFILTAAIYTGVYMALTFLINNVIFKEGNAKLAGTIICAVNLLFFVCFYLIMSKGKEKKKILAVVAFVLSAVISTGEIISMFALPDNFNNNFKRSPVQIEGTDITRETAKEIKDADFYIAPDGNDENDGSVSSPFLTFERAKEAVRSLDKSDRKGITVAVKSGDYRVESLTFGKEDSGNENCQVTYRAYGDGEAVINGGVTLPTDKFKKVTDEAVLKRFSKEASDKILCFDVNDVGITREQYGELYAIGSYNTAERYDGNYSGEIYSELFIDDKRMTLARYPDNNEYLYTGEVIREGKGREDSNANRNPDYEKVRNPESDVYKMDEELSARIQSWDTLRDVWMFGYWRYDWADASSPVGEVDHDNLTISPKFVSVYGAKEGAPYYFFNVLEELTEPGEWYLDRDRGIIYFYPPEGFSEKSTIDLSLATDNIIKAEGTSYLTLDGFTVKGTRGNAVSINGNGCVISNCLIKNVGENALIMNGRDNTAYNNEITRTGKGGIILDGGERETLKPGNNKAENNLIHDWSEIFETYQPAVTLNGTGNICAHNEIYNSPHEAITWSGNNHTIEYNLIHDVCLLADDGGAIYSGRRWDWYGTVIRYNLIYDLGSGDHKPVGIYLDDALSGQEVYGNIIINAPNIGIQLGGGRDLQVHDNIVINSDKPVTYDQRALTGLPGNESSNFHEHYKEGGSCWKLLEESPYKNDIWQKAYPQMKLFSSDFSDTENPDFVLNPAYSTVTHNILISKSGKIGRIDELPYKFSTIEDNPCFRLSKLTKIFRDPENGDYTLLEDAPVDFEIDIPSAGEIGRQTNNSTKENK